MSDSWGWAMPRFRLLGGVHVEDAPPVRSAVLRTLLAHLALEPGVAVPSTTLIDEIYGEDLPRHPSGALHVQVTRLRKWVAPTLVSSTAAGYVLEAGRDEVDLARFHDTADPRRALALRDGEAFPGCRIGPRLEAERLRADRRWLDLVETRARGLLDDGRPGEAVELTAGPLAGHPDRERLAGLAARAHHRAGHTAEALRVLAQCRRHLRVDLGIDPGPELREVEHAILDQAHRRRSDVVGRSGPLAVIRRGLDDPRGGRVVVVAGEAGIGKSTLLTAAAQEATRRGARVGRGLWEHDEAPFAAWAEALHAVGVQPPSPRDPAPGRTLRRRLVTAADDGLVLLALDDAHRADQGSLDVLRALGRAGVPAGVVVVVGVRDPDAVAHPVWSDAVADLAVLDGVERVDLRELDEAATRALVGPDRGAALATALWTRTGGHPLHLSALLAEIDGLPDEAGRLRAAGRVPDRLRPLLAHQLAQLPDDCRAALEALAVIGAVPLADLATVTGTPARRLAADLRPAVALTLLVATADGFAFRHELTADAVLEGVPGVVRAQLHQARHTALPGGAPPFTVLRHAVGAAALLPAATVADAHLPAVAAAYEEGALAAAGRLLDAAAPATTRPVRLRLLRGLVLEALGKVDEAATLFDEVVADPGVEIADAVAAALGDDAQGPSVAGRPRRLERLHRVAAMVLTPRQRARVLRGLIVEEQQLGGAAGGSLVTELLGLADPGAADGADPDPELAAEVAVARAYLALDAPMTAGERVAVSRSAHELAVAADSTALRFEADELCIAALVGTGEVEEALRRHARLGPEAEQRHRPRTMWAVRLVEASLLLAAGKPAAADELAHEAMTRGQELGIADAVGAYGVHLVVRHLLEGTLPTLGGLPAAAATMYPRVAAWPAAAAVDAVQAEDADAAAAHLAEFHRRREGRSGALFDRTGLALAAGAAYALSDAPTARLVLDAVPDDPGATLVVGIGASILGPVALWRGLACAALDDRHGALTHFRAAAATATRLGWTPWADAAELVARDLARTSGEPTPGPPLTAPASTPPLGLRPLR